MTLNTDELTSLADRVRREHGRRLPAAPVRESHGDRELRLERTKYQLETEILPLVNESRVAAREPTLSTEDEDRLVETILSSMFLLPRLLGILEREPLAEDVVVLGSSPVRVDRADGSVGLYDPIVRADRDLEPVIADVAAAHHRPFSFETPFVDVQLSPRLRFHGQGFDVVSRPMIAIRVHRALGATFADLFQWGALTAGLRYFLGEAAPRAGLSQAYTGAQGSGKTTFVRAVGLAHDEDTRMLTIETDFELGLASLGRPWTQEMQARIPIVASGAGITPADLMRPALRTRAEVNVIGRTRSPRRVDRSGHGRHGSWCDRRGWTGAARRPDGDRQSDAARARTSERLQELRRRGAVRDVALSPSLGAGGRRAVDGGRPAGAPHVVRAPSGGGRPSREIDAGSVARPPAHAHPVQLARLRPGCCARRPL